MKEITKIDILGETYTIYKCENYQDNSILPKYRAGECRAISNKIYIADLTDQQSFGTLRPNEIDGLEREVLRHEIFHAFLDQSGLRWNTENSVNGWATNEEMVDWLAIQSPKIFKVFKELKIEK